MNHSIHCTASAPSVPGSVYVLTFKNGGWADPLAEMEGVEDYDFDAKAGVLGVFHTCESAERVGEAWADLQFNTRVYDNCKTEEEEDKATDASSRGVEKSGDGYWRYSMSSWQNESLELEVNEMSVMTHFEGLEDEEEEEEDDDDDDDDEENGEEKEDEDGEGNEDDGDEGEMGDDKKSSDGAEEISFFGPFSSPWKVQHVHRGRWAYGDESTDTPINGVVLSVKALEACPCATADFDRSFALHFRPFWCPL